MENPGPSSSLSAKGIKRKGVAEPRKNSTEARNSTNKKKSVPAADSNTRASKPDEANAPVVTFDRSYSSASKTQSKMSRSVHLDPINQTVAGTLQEKDANTEAFPSATYTNELSDNALDSFSTTIPAAQVLREIAKGKRNHVDALTEATTRLERLKTRQRELESSAIANAEKIQTEDL